MCYLDLFEAQKEEQLKEKFDLAKNQGAPLLVHFETFSCYISIGLREHTDTATIATLSRVITENKKGSDSTIVLGVYDTSRPFEQAKIQ